MLPCKILFEKFLKKSSPHRGMEAHDCLDSKYFVVQRNST